MERHGGTISGGSIAFTFDYSNNVQGGYSGSTDRDVTLVSTLGTYQVNVNYTVPVQAQGISTSGSTGPTASEIATAILAAAQITPIHADARQMAGATIQGDGTAGNLWRGG